VENDNGIGAVASKPFTNDRTHAENFHKPASAICTAVNNDVSAERQIRNDVKCIGDSSLPNITYTKQQSILRLADAHELVAARYVFLAGVVVPKQRKAVGHSLQYRTSFLRTILKEWRGHPTCRKNRLHSCDSWLRTL
jgi:hypothetical protein